MFGVMKTVINKISPVLQSTQYTKFRECHCFFLPPLSYVAFAALNSFSSFGVILVVMKSKQVYGIWCKDRGWGRVGRVGEEVQLYSLIWAL